MSMSVCDPPPNRTDEYAGSTISYTKQPVDWSAPSFKKYQGKAEHMGRLTLPIYTRDVLNVPNMF